MPNQKPKLTPKARKAMATAQQRLNKEIFTKANRSRLMAIRKPPVRRSIGAAKTVSLRSAVILAPTAETKELTDFALPNIQEDGTLGDPDVIVQDVTVLFWLSVQNDLQIHFQYRVAGETGAHSWRKPPAVFEHSQLGMRSIVLPSGEYEFAQV